MKFLMKGYMLPDATQEAEIGGSLEVKFVLGSAQLLTGDLKKDSARSVACYHHLLYPQTHRESKLSYRVNRKHKHAQVCI